MRERKYVKFKLDIYDDTKTKIIDQKPERDFIHYFFARSIILAGKSNCEGELYMAKDTPYTIETLAIEFGRDAALVKLALDLLIELKMIEVTGDNVYRVKSFVKHQNIKVTEKAEMNDKEKINAATPSNREAEMKEDKQVENMDKEESDSCERIEDFENVRKNQGGSAERTFRNENKEITQDNIRNTDIAGVGINTGKINAEQDNLVVLETKDNKKSKKKKKSESDFVTELAVDEIEEDSPILLFSDGDMPPLGEGERLVWGMKSV